MDPSKLETRIERLPLKALRHLDVNARYMTADQQQRLTANVKRDGQLTSLPLVWLMQDEAGTPTSDPAVYEIISGNHRVHSAREAELTEIDCIVIANWISPTRRVEIQLAHNAVSGQDDLSVLEQLYEQLDLAGKEYSGLTDDAFASLKDISMTGFSVDGPTYQEIVLTFLPEDATEFEAMLKRIGKSGKQIVHVAQLEVFDALFDTIVRVKEQQNVQNNAIAIVTLAQLASERLDQLVAEGEAQEPDTDSPEDEDDEVIEYTPLETGAGEKFKGVLTRVNPPVSDNSGGNQTDEPGPGAATPATLTREGGAA